ncbi:MAG: hypothetical protein N0E54_15720 [Candidatus Thiodiazotropha taylori]|nr:hypothetical protein [Candidatus Thiodiazotropha endolucinida]MCW4230187.1 hypothetical protein [Candidatus Thiodiazotropha taylori]
MSIFEEILSKRFDRAANKNFPLLREFILMAASKKANVDIQITDANHDVVANLLALKKLIEGAKETIWAMTSDLQEGSALAQPQIVYNLGKWLNGGEHKVNILLKDSSGDFRDTYFFNELQKHVGSAVDGKVGIRYSLCKDVIDCPYNAIASDTGAFKVKLLGDGGAEKVIVNFRDENTARIIVEDIEFLFDDGIASTYPMQIKECQVNVSEKVVSFVDVLTKLVQMRKDVERVVPEDITPRALAL